MANNKAFETKIFETIEASDIDLSQVQAGAELEVKNKRQPRPQVIYLIAILCLVIASLAFIIFQDHQRTKSFADYQNVETRPLETPANAADKTNNSATDNPANNPALSNQVQPPAQTAKQRRQAQDLQANIIEKRRSLETQQVKLWAEANYLDAQKQVKQGDLLYQQAQYESAQQQYQLSLELLSNIENRLPTLISNKLASGIAAIEAGNITQARDDFELVLAIEEGNDSAKQGLQRLQQLPQVIDLLSVADQKFANEEFAAAHEAYQQATQFDPQHQRAITGLKKTKRKIRDSKLQVALNEGFGHLEQYSYAGATQAFKRALAIDPNSEVAAQSLLQAQTELNQMQINRLLTIASDNEHQEQWSLAVETYQQALNIDSSVVSATVGKLRSQTRATLDADLERVIQAPLRLASPQAYKQAQQLLTDAKGIQPGGPRLSEQVTQLEDTLRLATTPQSITLASDNATRVTILRVAKLGQFSEKIIQLKPGKYVAEGIREGYRDIRISFTVDGKSTASPIQVACREAI